MKERMPHQQERMAALSANHHHHHHQHYHPVMIRSSFGSSGSSAMGNIEAIMNHNRVCKMGGQPKVQQQYHPSSSHHRLHQSNSLSADTTGGASAHCFAASSEKKKNQHQRRNQRQQDHDVDSTNCQLERLNLKEPSSSTKAPAIPTEVRVVRSLGLAGGEPDDSSSSSSPLQLPEPVAIPDVNTVLALATHPPESPTTHVVSVAEEDEEDGSELAEGVEEQVGSSSLKAASNTTTAATAAATLSPLAASREQFLIFIKILFKILDQTNEIHTRNRAKKLVAECTRKNRSGDPRYTPLMEAVEKRLRLFVGEAHWRKAMMLLRHYYLKQKQQQQQPK